ncbi:unnamed protein product [Thlaspi arvense]|uniref:Uncharacterized protein n=1 Tax=Thlaspi arvense TaxID=13288 RepID=A0AAU9T689_THLAR|nr:unnamed protein product [Thlaspi arvense]
MEIGSWTHVLEETKDPTDDIRSCVLRIIIIFQRDRFHQHQYLFDEDVDVAVGDMVGLSKNGVVRSLAKENRTDFGNVPRHDRFQPFDGKFTAAAFPQQILTAEAVDHLAVTLESRFW